MEDLELKAGPTPRYPSRRPIAFMVLIVHGLGILHTGYALVFLLSPERNLLNPSFAVATQILPMRVWGWVFAGIAVLHAIGVTRSPRIARIALLLGAFTLLLFATFFGMTWWQALHLPASDPRSHSTALGVFVGYFCGGVSLLCAMSLDVSHTPDRALR